MIPLQTEFKKNGYQYQLLERSNDTAIFKQLSEGKIIAYEVVEVIYQKEWTAFGKTYPAKESIPSTENWGTNAFTVHAIDRAKEKSNLIQLSVNERKAKREPISI